MAKDLVETTKLNKETRISMKSSKQRIVLARTYRPFIVGYMTARGNSLILTSRAEWGYEDTVNVAFFGVTFIDMAQRMPSLEISTSLPQHHMQEYNLFWEDKETNAKIEGSVRARSESVEFTRLPSFLGDKWGISGSRPVELTESDETFPH